MQEWDRGAFQVWPCAALRSMRGLIIDARIAYPEVLHVEIKDSTGELWRLATQDAEWSPANPSELIGRSVEDADIDEETGELRFRVSGDLLLDVKPATREAEDDPPNWELITPGGAVLEFGPGVRWQIGSAEQLLTDRTSFRVDAEARREIIAAVARPARARPELAKLLTKDIRLALEESE